MCLLCKPKTLLTLIEDRKLMAAFILVSNIYSLVSMCFLNCYPSQHSDPLAHYF